MTMNALSTEAPSATVLLEQEIEDVIAELEQNIPATIRPSMREQIKRLLKLSIQDPELVKTKSVRGLYRFLSASQCTVPPGLSLSEDGMVYARWRQSRSRSIGALFLLDGLSVDYGLRNLPKRHGGTTSPTELWALISQLGFGDLIRLQATVTTD